MKWIKSVVKAFIVAFSIYSKIPMPRFTWESDDMKYHLCFFPWVGAVIGGAEWLWYLFCTRKGIGALPFVLIAIAIPVLITGGFHLDGFMDTCDAIHSYQDKEKKLEILKDPHIGAFAVICLAAYFLLAGGALAVIYEAADFAKANACAVTFLPGDMLSVSQRALACCALSFFLARTLSGLSVITMHGAKKQGMLQTFSDTAVKNTVYVFLILQLIIGGTAAVCISPVFGGAALLALALSYLYYWRMSTKQFGGITGDIAGYFVSVSEAAVLIVIAAVGIIL